MICPVCKACKGVTLVDIGAGFINTEVVCGGGQGDYDGSGQQSCKCNYVDFSK